ncbi:MAG: hypothetical protein D3925_13185, partial [Candidatus Electrothrix sp. AR5]|nr:hypothetical protein [Candidatus Electrothrix sp. AR5]
MKTSCTPLLYIVLVLLQGCSLVSQKSALVPLDPEQIHEYLWQDDQDFRNLKHAVKQSLRYYQGLPAQHTFNYGEITYTAREMEASTQLFLGIIDDYDGDQRLSKIQENFLFFESRNADRAAFFTGYY